MSDVGAPQRLFAGAPGGGGASGSSGRVVNPPASMLQLGGDALPGIVLGRSPQGQLLVQGDFGKGPVTLAIATAARFAAGATVSLIFRPHVSGLFVTILPRTAAVAPGATIPRPPGSQPAATGGRAPDKASIGAAAAPGGGRLPAGLPAAGLPTAGLGQPRTDASAVSAAGPGASQEPAAAARAGAPTGNTLHGTLSGVVAGRDGEGRLLVGGSFGQLAVDTPNRIPQGTRVLLQIASGAAGPVATLFAEPLAGTSRPVHLQPLGFGAVSSAEPAPPPAPSSAATPASLARVWPTLAGLAEAFAEAQATPLGPLLPAGFPPKVGPRLALSLLRFLQAAQGPGLLPWLGPAGLGGPAMSQPGLSPARLQEADEELRWLGRDPPGDWRLVLLPLIGQGPPEALRLFLKKRRAEAEGDAAAPTHFLCDLSLSRLGALQLEGLLREVRFDLVLRSRRPLDDALREELTGIFVSASEAGGLGGAFRFQAGDDWLPLPVPHSRDDIGFSV
ncbi:MAG: hypothetical protein WD341_11920 [Tistlia sp.]|uniref:hypothetical protein n=1 Tax=Tistlia sp. TaxID=3057121 RepID=UPI0034A171A0